MNADAATSGARPITEDEAAELRVRFANMRADAIEWNARTLASYERARADVIESNERNRADVIASNERSRADLIAANKERDIQMATWITEARTNRSVVFWAVGVGIGACSLLTAGIGLLIGYPDVIARIFGG